MEHTEAKAGAQDPHASPVTSVLGGIPFSLGSLCDGGALAFLMMLTGSENYSVTG